jgi:AP-1-like factor
MQAGGLSRSPPYVGGIASYFTTAPNGVNANNFQFEFPKFGSLPGGVFNNNNNNAVKPVSPPLTNSIVNTPPSNSASGALSRDGSNGGGMSPKSQNRANGSTSSASSPPQQNGQQRGSIQGEIVNNDRPAGLYGISGFTGASNATNQSLDFFSTSPAQQPQNSRSSTADHTTIDQSRLFQFKSNSTSTDSPSTSSTSQYGGANSSCGTSPEPSHNSPPNANKDQVNEQGYICRSGSDGEISFCEKLNMACGNPQNPVPRALSKSGSSNGGPATQPNTAGAPNNTTSTATAAAATTTATTPGNLLKGIDYFATQNGGQFDPMLFGDYRDSQAAIVGDGDFTGGFFNDALPSAVDFGSPFNWDVNISTGLTPALQKPNPMEAAMGRADALANGKAGEEEEEVVPADDMGNMMSCHKIWYVFAFSPMLRLCDADLLRCRDRLQDNKDFKEGTLDIDTLCTELRSKARCSETGVVIDKKDVDDALNKLPAKRQVN